MRKRYHSWSLSLSKGLIVFLSLFFLFLTSLYSQSSSEVTTITITNARQTTYEIKTKKARTPQTILRTQLYLKEA